MPPVRGLGCLHSEMLLRVKPLEDREAPSGTYGASFRVRVNGAGLLDDTKGVGLLEPGSELGEVFAVHFLGEGAACLATCVIAVLDTISDLDTLAGFSTTGSGVGASATAPTGAGFCIPTSTTFFLAIQCVS